MRAKGPSVPARQAAVRLSEGCGGPSHLRTASATRSAERPVPTLKETEDALGHWRNRWDVPEKHASLARRQGALPLGDGTWLGYRRFPSSEAAEKEAQRFAEYNYLVFGIRYIGPEFFPEY